MNCLQKTIVLLAVVGCLQVSVTDAQAQYQAYTYNGGYGYYPYYHPQFQYMPPSMMASPAPSYQPFVPNTIASSEAAQNAAAQAQSARIYLGLESPNSQTQDKYGNALTGIPGTDKPSSKGLRDIEAMAAPHRLSPMQYDRANHLINWPMTLRAPQFADVRYKLDKLFHERTSANSGEASVSAKAIAEACQQMQAILKQEITELHPMEYIAAQQFIDSLAYEARFAEHP